MERKERSKKKEQKCSGLMSLKGQKESRKISKGQITKALLVRVRRLILI